MKIEAASIKNWGHFYSYTPTTPPPGYEETPSGVVFARNDRGEDFYTVIYRLGEGASGRTFMLVDPVDNAVRCSVLDSPGFSPPARTGLPMAANTDWVVLEITGLPPLNFARWIWDGALEFSEPPAFIKHFLSKKVLWDRMTEAEAEQFDADLIEAPAKMRRAFDAAQILNDQDGLWPAFEAAIRNRVSDERADELLIRTE